MEKYFNQLVQQLLPASNNRILAEQEAWWLLEAVTRTNKSSLLSNPPTLTQQQLNILAAFITQRVKEHKPLQYVLENVPFCGLTIKVKPPILIPRPETEEWVTWLIDLYKKAGITDFTAIDACTGSGCIGSALAQHFPQAKIIGIDINPSAIDLANQNKHHLNLSNISFITADICKPLPQNVVGHLLVSNPPYLTPTEYTLLDPDVRQWEDRTALVGGHDGMLFYQTILNQAAKILQPLTSRTVHLPNVIIEVGPAQDKMLEKLLASMHITTYAIHKDLQGNRRWIAITLSCNDKTPKHHS